jgi:RHS repeat-associated protein
MGERMSGVRVLLSGVLVSLLAVAGLSSPATAAPSVKAAAPIQAPAAIPAAVPRIAPAALPAVVTDAPVSGVFVPSQGRLVDTRDGTGGVTGPVAANTWVPIQVLGLVGIPAAGAKAVVLTVTSINAASDNWTQLASNTERPDTQTTNLYAGANDILSNTSMVPVGTDGKIALRTSVSQHYVIEVQGYFTAGDVPAPGGYVPILGQRLVDTRDGTGIPAGQWSDGQVKTVKLKNVGGIPDTAGSVFANVILISTDPNNLTPTLYPYPGGATDPLAPLHYRGGVTTGVGTTLDLNAAGEVSFRVANSSSPVHIVIDVEGYFDGQASDSSFHSLATRLYDSRTTGSIPAGESVEVQVAGVNGLPDASAELAGVTMNITAINSATATTTGWFRAYPSDEPEQPQSQVNYHLGGDAVSNVVVIRPGTVDGKIIVRNLGTAPADFLIDTQGWFTNAHLLPPASGPNGAASGERGAASMVGHQLSDSARTAWNPTNGNTVLTGQLLHLRGAGQDTNITWRYNSLNDARPTLNLGRVEAALRVDAGTAAVTYTAPDGGWYTFTSTGPGTWAMPPDLNAALTKPGPNEYRIRFNDSGVVNVYTDDGANYSLARSIDANVTSPNTITYAYTNGVLDTTTDTQGRTVKYLYEDTRNLNQPSKITDQSINRSVNLEYAGDQGRLSKITDATAVTTTFAYNTAGKLSAYTDGRTTTASFEYDASARTSKITYGTGTPAQSIWTPAYPSATTSTLTDPNTKTATYTFNATTRQVTAALDPKGNNVTGTWDAHDNRLTSVDGLVKTTTATYNANNTMAKIISPLGGASGTGSELSYTYPAPTGNDTLFEHRPATSTNREGQITTYSYDVNTSYLKKTQTPGPSGGAGGAPTRNYQNDDAGTTCSAKRGQLCKTTDGNGNITSYAYDTAGNPTTITRPAPLGVLTYTYDAAGRAATVTDGKSQTLTNTYDNNDRLTQVRQGATCVAATCVTYTYDANGNLTQRVDASGTTTVTYDAQNRPATKTIGGTTTSLTYDGASNILTSVDPLGTVTYKYDAANLLISLAEPGGSCPGTPAYPNATRCTGFDYDANNSRIATKYPTGVKNTTVIDPAGRITSITATNANTPAGVLAQRTYAYTANGTKEGALRKTMTDQASTLTTYGYDVLNRLTSAVTGTVTETWGYDKNGNRILDTKTGTANVNSAFNAADQLCWAGASAAACASPPAGAVIYGYDTNGSTTTAGATTQAYNIFDQFTSNTNGATTNYTYTGAGNTERLTAGATSFLNGTLGITRQTTGGAGTSFIRDPDGNLISMRISTGASYYYTTDGLGSIILLTDSAQNAAATYAYDSWGNTTATGAQAAVNPWQYAGGYNDTSNNRIKFGARYYNPFRGRFTQTDPSGQETNAYLYAGTNPINNTDLTGMAWCDAYGVCSSPAPFNCYSFNNCGQAPPGPNLVQQCAGQKLFFGLGIGTGSAVGQAKYNKLPSLERPIRGGLIFGALSGLAYALTECVRWR